MGGQIPKLLSEVETAEALGVSPATLATWRCTGRYALPFTKVGRLVRYREPDVAEFLESRTSRPVDAGR